MTILPKKKSSKEKSGEKKENSDLGHAAPAHSHSLPHVAVAAPHGHSLGLSGTLPLGANDGRHDRAARSRNSPPHWVASAGLEETFETDNHDSTAGLLPTSSKRRNRSSPHHMMSRKAHRHDRCTTASTTRGTTSTAASSTVVLQAKQENYSLVKNHKEEEIEKFNSDDELDFSQYSEEEYDELERWFEKVLKEKRRFVIKKMANDGSCLFRAVADQVYGDQEMHAAVRKMSLDYMAKNRDHFSTFITEDFNHYIDRKRVLGCHGNHIEIQAVSELFNRPVEVYQYSIEPINIFNGSYKTDNAPIRLSYHRGMHYNSVVDPYAATIGVGLGLPGFQPGLAEKNLMSQAKNVSENYQLEQTMLKDKLKETDWELTQEAMEEQAARESYLQWLKDNEKRAIAQASPRSASAACSSAADALQLEQPVPALSPDPSGRPLRSPRSRTSGSGQNSPKPVPSVVEHLVDHGTVTSDHNPMVDVPNPVAMVTDQLPGSSAYSMHSTMAGCSSSVTDHQVAGSSSAQAASHLPGGSSVAMMEEAVAPPLTFPETRSIMNGIPPDMLGFSEWDDDAIMAQVIAQSAQEYFDRLKKPTDNS